MSGKSSGARHRVRGKKGNRRLFVRSQTRCNPDRLKPSRSIRTFNGRRPDRCRRLRGRRKKILRPRTLFHAEENHRAVATWHHCTVAVLLPCKSATSGRDTDRIRRRSRRRVREKNQPTVLGEKPDARECQNNWKSAGASVL
jgi:hypothetical protein